jgi:hypothetical protein
MNKLEINITKEYAIKICNESGPPFILNLIRIKIPKIAIALSINFKTQILLIRLTKVLNAMTFTSNVGKENAKPNTINKGKTSKIADAFLPEPKKSSISTTPIGPIRTVINQCFIR